MNQLVAALPKKSDTRICIFSNQYRDRGLQRPEGGRGRRNATTVTLALGGLPHV